MAAESGHLSIGAWASAAIVVVLVFLWFSRLGRDSVEKQPLKLGKLWISALVYVALASSVIALQPPHGAEWRWLEVGVASGGVVGWWYGKTTEITAHPITGTLTTRTSLVAAAFLLGLMTIRYALSKLLLDKADALHVKVQLITGALLAFAVGLVVVQRVEMTLRAMRLSGQAAVRGAAALKPSAAGAPPVSGQASPDAIAASVRTGVSTTRLAMLAAAVFAIIVIVGLVMPR